MLYGPCTHVCSPRCGRALSAVRFLYFSALLWPCIKCCTCIVRLQPSLWLCIKCCTGPVRVQPSILLHVTVRKAPTQTFLVSVFVCLAFFNQINRYCCLLYESKVRSQRFYRENYFHCKYSLRDLLDIIGIVST